MTRLNWFELNDVIDKYTRDYMAVVLSRTTEERREFARDESKATDYSDGILKLVVDSGWIVEEWRLERDRRTSRMNRLIRDEKGNLRPRLW